MKTIYRIYQLVVVVPIGVAATLLTALVTVAGCALGGNRFWGYYPGKWWSWLLVRLFLLPVKVEGRENLEKGQGYIFCPNHQGAFDIFLVYGFLGRNFKWVMKKSLRNIPFVGKACEAAGFVFIDKSSPKKIQQSMEKAENILRSGISLVIFPEGSRSYTGEMAPYKRGAFLIADELQLPVVPVSITGSFNVMPRTRDGKFVTWHPLTLTIHKPLCPIGKGSENIKYLMDESYRMTKSQL